MAQHDYVIANGTGAAVRSDLNNALAAIVSQNSGATEPTTTYAYMPWADSATGLYKIRNAANNGWITLYQLDGEWSTLAIENGSAAAPSIYFKDSGTDTGIYSPGTDQVAISTGGTVRLSLSTTAVSSALAIDHPLGAVGTPSITFTGDLNTGIYSPAADTLAFVEGGVEAMRIDSSGRVGIGTTTPSHRLNVVQTAGGVMANFTNNADADFQIGCTSGVTTIGPDVGVLALKSASTERARLDASGRLLVGTSTTEGFGAKLQIRDDGGLNCEMFRSVASASGPTLALNKSRGSAGSPTVVSSGDVLSYITGKGYDGAAYQEAAAIKVEVGGTPGANDMPGRLVFSTTEDGASSPTERMRITSAGLVLAGVTSSSAHTFKVNATEGTHNITDGIGFSVYSGTGGTPSVAATNIVVYRNSTTSRSINAGGTINASGADYAEYMFKAGNFTIVKGDICGVTADGLLTDIFADAISFVVKSTNPSYVGGDTWGGEDTIGPKPEADDTEALAQWENNLEATRQKVDRIAFAGQVPVNVTGATPGQYIVPVATEDGGITGIAKNEADLTLAEYMQAVGKVIAIEDDGRARIIVKVA